MVTAEQIKTNIASITEYLNGMIAENYYTVKPLTEKQAEKVYRYMLYAEKRDPWQSWPDYLEFALTRYGMIDSKAEFAAVREAIETGDIFK